MKITLTDLTKNELLELIHSRGFLHSISDRDINRIRWNTMTRKAQKMMDDACVEMKKYHGPQNFAKYKEQMDNFDRGMALMYEAENVYNNRIQTDAKEPHR